MARLVCMVFLAAISTLVGCGSGKDREQAEPALTSTPLLLDPTEDVEIAQWWSNGMQLLRLDDNAGYVMFDTVNRYGKPRERGRWSQQSYAVLRLEPYSRLRTEEIRVGITRIDGKLALELPKMRPMFALKNPPPVLEDRLIGRWDGPLGELTLLPDLRYSLKPRSDASQPATRGAQNGRWSVIDEAIVLQPDAPNVDPTRMAIVADDKKVTINGPGGTLARQQLPAM